MGQTSKFLELLKILAEKLPSLITMIACIGFALSRRKRYPRVSTIVIIGLVLLILHIFISNIIYVWAPDWFLDRDNYDPVRSRNFYLVFGLIVNTFAALGMAVLLAAVFALRNRNFTRTARPPMKA